MARPLLFIFAVAIVLAMSSPAFAQEQEKKSASAPAEMSAAVQKHQLQSEVWTLQKQNAELRAQIADLNARLDSVALNAMAAPLQVERRQLEDFIRATAGAPADAPVDWSKSPPTVTWTPPAKVDPSPKVKQ